MPGRFRLSRRARASRSPSSISESLQVASTGWRGWSFRRFQQGSIHRSACVEGVSVLKNSPVRAIDPSYDPEIGVFGLLEPTRTPINVSRSSFSTRWGFLRTSALRSSRKFAERTAA